ncbi:hypothetical protein C8R44DRAFT_882798 [Mycena epipterygia]|nr:hypothetical protein C8R44DRAFT_882798 [Mycena epipterygia]
MSQTAKRIQTLEDSIKDSKTRHSEEMASFAKTRKELEAEIARLKQEVEENTTTVSLDNEDRFEYMNLIPSSAGRRSFVRLGPVYSALETVAELEAHLTSASTCTQRVSEFHGAKNSALTLHRIVNRAHPGLTLWTSKDQLHAVAYLPTVSYDHHTGWTKRIGIRELDGKTELFMLRR